MFKYKNNFSVILIQIMLFIGPPFGNYFGMFHHFNNKNNNSISVIHGSFTKDERTGLFSQIIKTLRFSFQHNGWINCIGLRNPGIQYAIQNNLGQKNDIVSIAIKKETDIEYYKKYIPENTNIEINISCPNSTVLNNNMISTFLNGQRKWCIVKLSPLEKNETIDRLYNLGFRQYHCCNTLPLYKEIKEKNIFRGGLSGPSLIPYVCDKIHYIKHKYHDTTVIAGGGIQSMDTIELYKKHGADHFAISTICFNPLRFAFFYYQYIYHFRNK